MRTPTRLNTTDAQENLSYVMGAELQRLPVSDADRAWNKLQAGKPKLKVRGEGVDVLFSDGTLFCSTTISTLLATHHHVERRRHGDADMTRALRLTASAPNHA